MHCEHCGSENVKRYSVVCDEGTSVESIAATSRPVWNTNPFSPHGTREIKGTSTVKTELAQRCSPPSEPGVITITLIALPLMCIGIYFGIFLGYRIGVLLDSFWLGLVAVLILIFCVIYAAVSIGNFLWKNFLGGEKAMRNYRKDLDVWQRSWYCTKCGGVTVSKSAR
jgi:hypothetical protein